MLKNTCFHLNYNMRPPCIPVSLHMKRCWWNGDVLASVCCGWQWVRTVNRQQLAYVAFVLPSPAVSEEANAKMTGAAAGVALRMVVVVFCVCCCWSFAACWLFCCRCCRLFFTGVQLFVRASYPAEVVLCEVFSRFCVDIQSLHVPLAHVLEPKHEQLASHGKI